MDEEKWTPDSAFSKAWSFVKYASGEAAKTKDPIGAIVLVGMVWLVYFPVVMVVFPFYSFLWFIVKKAFR